MVAVVPTRARPSTAQRCASSLLLLLFRSLSLSLAESLPESFKCDDNTWTTRSVSTPRFPSKPRVHKAQIFRA